MARYYRNVPRKYDENEWALTQGHESDKVPEGIRLADDLWKKDLKEDEEVHCIYCLDTMGSIGGGDEFLDYCYNCETIMEGEPKIVLDEEEYDYLMGLS